METQDKRLARLEAATARLVHVAGELRQERDRLRDRLSAAEQDDRALRVEVATLREERTAIRKRLEAIDAALANALTTETEAVATKSPPARRAKAAPAPAVEELTLF
jgi:chromosome segregation ATPase